MTEESRLDFGQGQRFTFLHSVQNSSWPHPIYYIMGTADSTPGGEQAGRESMHSSPICAEVNNAYSYPLSARLQVMMLNWAQGQIYLHFLNVLYRTYLHGLYPTILNKEMNVWLVAPVIFNVFRKIRLPWDIPPVIFFLSGALLSINGFRREFQSKTP
jgi:hypothetical protein